MSFLMRHIRGFMTAIHPITGDADLDHLVEMVEDGCLHSKFTIFPFVMNIVGRVTLRLCKNPISLQTFTH